MCASVRPKIERRNEYDVLRTLKPSKTNARAKARVLIGRTEEEDRLCDLLGVESARW